MKPAALTVNSSLNEVIDHLDQIPGEKWVKGTLVDNGRCCGIGHLNVALHGHAMWKMYGQNTDVETLIGRIGANIDNLIRANNHSEDSKVGVLAYLRNLNLKPAQ